LLSAFIEVLPIFPLLDVFVRQVSDQPVDEISYRELFKNWCQNYSSKFFSQFDLNSELNGQAHSLKFGAS
jgi:hypothetical protein